MPSNNWFLTGKPGTGKSTVIQSLARLLKAKDLIIGGIISPEIRDAQQRRVGFRIQDLYTGRQELMAHIAGDSNMRIGKYRVMMQAIDAVCGEAFPYAFQKADVILIDEIGPMELFSQGFKHYVKQAMNQYQPVVAVIHQKTRGGFIRELKKLTTVNSYLVNESERDFLPEKLFKELQPELNIG